MTDQEYRQRTIDQVNELMESLRLLAVKKVDKALQSGAVPPEWADSDNYLLSKAVIDSLCRDRLYGSDNYQEDYDNLHIFLS